MKGERALGVQGVKQTDSGGKEVCNSFGVSPFTVILRGWWCLTIATPWSAAHQAPLSVEVSRQEYWSGLPFPSPVFPLYLELK